MTKFCVSDFYDATGVSCETLDKLSLYVALLLKWQSRFNLVGSSTLQDIWLRHMLDSAQIFPHINGVNSRVLDLGSGAGFPGLVLSIMGSSDVVLLEANKKKCSFLREVVRQTDCEADIFNGRIEEYPEVRSAGCITSRALAALDSLLFMSYPLLLPEGQCLFLKGEKYEEELTLARKKWNMDVKIHPPNLSGFYGGVCANDAPPGVLIEIRNLSPRD